MSSPHQYSKLVMLLPKSLKKDNVFAKNNCDASVTQGLKVALGLDL